MTMEAVKKLGNVLIADDHEVTRRGLREILREAFPDVQIYEAADAASVIAEVPAREWDLILLDVLMPGGTVLETLSTIRSLTPTVPILILTALTEVEYVLQTMKAGANGLIHKHQASDELLVAIRQVANGGRYLHPETAIAIASGLPEKKDELPHDRLSTRELEVFRLIAQGRAVKEVAADLGLSDKTVATYLSRIREKTGLSSHVEIARYALQKGLVE
jgi:DNA-binding NarL/FixJ family response regulator